MNGPRWLRVLGACLLVGAVLAAIVWAAYGVAHQASFVGLDDNALIAFASLSLLALSVVVGLLGAALAFFGWPEVQKLIRRRVDKEVQNRLSGARNEYLGNVKLVEGLIYGRLCREEHKDEIQIVKPTWLERAINTTREALDHLSDIENLGALGKERSLMKAKNNLAFYYALDGRHGYGPKAVSIAEELSQEEDFGDNPSLINTYCRVVAAYAGFFDEPEDRLSQACEMSEELVRMEDVKLEERKNARRHLSALRRAQEKRSKEGGD